MTAMRHEPVTRWWFAATSTRGEQGLTTGRSAMTRRVFIGLGVTAGISLGFMGPSTAVAEPFFSKGTNRETVGWAADGAPKESCEKYPAGWFTRADHLAG